MVLLCCCFVILFFVQFYFDKFYQPTIFCHWFWAVEAVVLIIYYFLEIRTFIGGEGK